MKPDLSRAEVINGRREVVIGCGPEVVAIPQ